METKYWCYIINSDNHTYCGYTKNPIRRIRQHNGEIVGGAKATRGKQWNFMMLMTGFETSNNALSCEWRLKHPDGHKRKSKKYNGINGRILTINKILCYDKWTMQCDILNNKCEYTIYILDELYDKLNSFSENIKVLKLSTLKI